MSEQRVAKVDVELNALCYAFWQAVDYICVVYKDAADDEQVHFMQAQQLATAICKRYAACDEETRANCYWYDQYIADVASCGNLADYKRVCKAFDEAIRVATEGQ